MQQQQQQPAYIEQEYDKSWNIIPDSKVAFHINSSAYTDITSLNVLASITNNNHNNNIDTSNNNNNIITSSQLRHINNSNNNNNNIATTTMNNLHDYSQSFIDIMKPTLPPSPLSSSSLMMTSSSYHHVTEMGDIMSFADLDASDFPSYISDEVTGSSPPHVTSTLSPYQEFAGLDTCLAVQHSNTAVPSVSPHLGEYNFEVSVQKQTKETKSANWIFSKQLEKLYVKMKTPCPFLFRTSRTPPRGSVVRAMPIYWNPEHMNEVAKRCPTHVANSKNEHPSQVRHLLTSEHREARHMEDPLTKRLSVIIPHEEPQVGSLWVTSLFQFMCYSSCHGGYNRRPLHVIFTLEHDNQVLGRQVIKVRLCACPGRDWDNEANPRGKKKRNGNVTSFTTDKSEKLEQLESNSKAKPVIIVSQNRKRKLGSSTFNSSSSSSSSNVSNFMLETLISNSNEEYVDEIAQRMNPDDDLSSSKKNFMCSNETDVYTLRVVGRLNFEILRKLRDSLHVVGRLPVDVLDKYAFVDGSENDSDSLSVETKPKAQFKPKIKMDPTQSLNIHSNNATSNNQQQQQCSQQQQNCFQETGNKFQLRHQIVIQQLTTSDQSDGKLLNDYSIQC